MKGVDIGQQYNSPVKSLDDVGKIVSSLTSNLYVLAGVVLLVLLLWGGLEIISGAGTDDRDKVGRGKKIITAAISGFLIIFTAYWIIQLIELVTGLKII